MTDDKRMPWPTKAEFREAISEAKHWGRLLRALGVSPLTMAVLAVGTLKIFRDDGHGPWIDALADVPVEGDESALAKVYAMFTDDVETS